jgi:Zn-dependent protease/predicted transcriptional regulator
MRPPGYAGGASSAPATDSISRVRILGVPVRFHFTFVLFLLALLVLGLGKSRTGPFTIAYLLSLFLSVLLHEFGHALVARRFGVHTTEITMLPFGGVSRMERSLKPHEEFWVALAGPAVNLLLSLILFACVYWRNQNVDVRNLNVPTDANLLLQVAFGNLLLAAFNLLPAFPMDGGRALRAILARFRDEDNATRIAAAAGRWLAFAICTYGLLNQEYLLVFVAFSIYVGAAQEGTAAMGRALTHGIPVRAAMVTDFRVLNHGNTIGDAAKLLLASSQQDFPVFSGEQVVGLLHRNGLLRGMADEGADAYVASAMNRQYISLDPDMDLAEALPLMAEAGSCALVMEGEHLAGLLTAENLSEFLLLRRVGMEPNSIAQTSSPQ